MSDEFKEEKLDSPLIVHKKSDASYQDTASETEMSETHSEDDGPTLERHRFKKKGKKKGKGLVIVIIIVILAAVFAGLYLTGNITFDNGKTTTAVSTTKQVETTVNLAEEYKDTIVVKGTDIYVDSQKVDGIEGLQEALKYEDKSTTRYTIIDENADADFLNLEVLSILESLGFYDESTTIKHVDSTNLEDTTQAPSTTTEKSTSAPKTTTKPASSTTANE
ncbi:MAG: hypothetical protein ACI4IE_02850 [Eubacterium sp.]